MKRFKKSLIPLFPAIIMILPMLPAQMALAGEPLPLIPTRQELNEAGWTEVIGSDFTATGVWGWTAAAGGTVARQVDSVSGGYLSFNASGNGGRSASRLLSANPGGVPPVSAGQIFTIFDWKVPTGSIGGNPNTLTVSLRDGSDHLVGLRLGRQGGGANWRIGVYSGEPLGPVDNWAGVQILPAPFQGSGILGQWLRVGVYLDIGAQMATVSVVRRGTNDTPVSRTVPINGAQIDRMILEVERASGQGVSLNDCGIDNLWFFTYEDPDYAITEVLPYSFLQTLPANPGLLVQSWAKTVFADNINSLADLGLPATIDVRTVGGDIVAVPVNWVLNETPRAYTGQGFDPDFPGVWTFNGVIQNIPGVAENTKQIPAPLLIDLRPEQTNLARSAEWLDRGVVAVPVAAGHGGGMLVKWRVLAYEYALHGLDIAFNVYRNGEVINNAPIVALQNFVDNAGTPGDEYQVRLLQTGAISDPVVGWAQNFMTLDLQRPAPRTIAGTGNPTITYEPVDVAVGDVTGNGRYELLVRWNPSMGQDPGLAARITGETIYDLYTLEGELLWRINMGHNISSDQQHSHTRSFWDLTETGRADFAIKTAIGTRVFHPNEYGIVNDLTDIPAAILHSVGDSRANNALPEWRTPTAPVHHQTGYDIFAGGFAGTLAISGTPTGRIRNGPEFFTVFNGLTGLPIDTVNYFAHYDRGMPGHWGDPGANGTNNRSNRFGGTIAYLPKGGVPGAQPFPSVIEVRGHYGPHFVGAYQLIDGEIELIWEFSLGANPGTNPTFGNHQMMAADVNGDGYDEIIFGSLVLNHDGTILWAADGTRGTSRGTHGDALHVAAMSPHTTDLWIMTPQEGASANSTRVYNAATGEDVMTNPVAGDPGRGVAANILPTPGFEIWSSNTAAHNVLTGQRTHTGGTDRPNSQNFRLYWGDTLLSYMYDGQTNPSVRRFSLNGNDGVNTVVQTFTGTNSNWGTKATPALTADIFGCWREDVVVRANTNDALRIYTTNIPTGYLIYTLMHDPVFRLHTNAQGNVYNQPNHLGFYLGVDVRDAVLAMELPVPNIWLTTTPVIVPTTEFSGTSPNQLSAMLLEENVILQTQSNLGIFEQHSPFTVPAGRTLYVETTLNIQRGATLVIEGTVVVLPGGRINNQGNNASGGTITIADGGTLLNDGYVENVSNSILVNNGTIINNARFEVRANTVFTNNGIVDGDTPLSIHRNATLD